MSQMIWLIEKRRGVRISALTDDAHGMVELGTHDYENPDDVQFKGDWESAEARRKQAAADARAKAATQGASDTQAAPEAATATDAHSEAQDVGHGQ